MRSRLNLAAALALTLSVWGLGAQAADQAGQDKQVLRALSRAISNVAAEGEGHHTTAGALGLSVQDLTTEMAGRLGIRAKAGVVVTAVDENGPAAQKGIALGNAIIEVDRKPVKNTREFEAALGKADLSKGVLLLVADNAGSRFVLLKAEAKEKGKD